MAPILFYIKLSRLSASFSESWIILIEDHQLSPATSPLTQPSSPILILRWTPTALESSRVLIPRIGSGGSWRPSLWCCPLGYFLIWRMSLHVYRLTCIPTPRKLPVYNWVRGDSFSSMTSGLKLLEPFQPCLYWTNFEAFGFLADAIKAKSSPKFTVV